MILPTVALLLLCNTSLAAPTQRGQASPVNKGLVAIGIVPANARDTTGTTIGGIGSAIALKRGTFRKTSGGTYTGTLIVQPDRGYKLSQLMASHAARPLTVDNTVDFQGRQHEFNFNFKPYYGAVNLSYADAQKTLKLTYKRTLLYTERFGKHTTGLDPLDVRPKTKKDPIIPVPSVKNKNNLSIDAESLVLDSDGRLVFHTSPGEATTVAEAIVQFLAYVYKFDRHGDLQQVIQPPQAVVPYLAGKVNFTSATNPDTGRFEGLTASPDGKKLYAMLQSALIQDGGDKDKTSRYARLLEYNVAGWTPKLTREWVVPLPQTDKGKTLAQSEIHYLDGKKFLVLSRDGHGNGDDESTSAYKSVDILDISRATDIHGTSYDQSTPVSPGGVLAAGVTPAEYTQFVSLIDNNQLGRFGLHNGGAFDDTLIAAKWESLALAPVFDPRYPHDYFLFVGADNDFNTLDGTMVGEPYSTSYGRDVQNQFMVYRVTLPTVPNGSVAHSIGI
ncbi:hypothetical protein FRB99_000081 [Tulasnella sp. 403]|nr:hypothetical protein FRB99_000081 [Tulasnella sp. 403]